MNESNYPIINRFSKIVLIISGIIGLASIIFEYGFGISKRETFPSHYISVLVVIIFILYFIVQLIIAKKRLEYFLGHKVDFIIILLILVETIAATVGYSIIEQIGLVLNLKDISYLYIVFAQVYIIVGLLLGGLRYNKKILQTSLHPSRIFVLSFLVTIFTGAFLLMLPASTIGGKINFIDALFTSTSAVCVTGLITVDTATFYTEFGQIIIMLLIQIGGLGLMTFTTFFAIFLSGGMGIKERFVLHELLNEENVGAITKILSYLVFITLAIELLGAAFLYYSISDVYVSFERAAFISIFHSVSAFCNAGFSLYSQNLMDPVVKNNYLFTTVISFLIILGGLGFPTIMGIFSFEKIKKVGISSKQGRQIFTRTFNNKLSLEVKTILYTSLALILIGGLFTYILEFNNSLKGLDWFAKIHAAYFQSVSARTAGFNTVSIGEFSDPTSILYSILMFIGASPGGTGGGIKTTTFIILMVSIRAILREERQITLSKRSIQGSIVYKAFSKVVVSFLVILLGIFILSLTEKSDVMTICFEAFSAFGTVGLSKNFTNLLSETGKYVIILLMFIGRVGAIAFIYSLLRTKEPVNYELPSENISIL